MADKKISQLTGAVTPLAGTEVLPLVQSGATLKVTAENIFTTTQPSGNANGIVYLNGSKQATTSASFFYNGSNLGINTSTATAIFGKTIQIGNGSTNNTIYMVGSGGGSGFLANVGTVFNLTGRGTTTLAFGTNDADRVTIDLSGNTTLLMGNLVIGTAGKGIDFSANGGDVLTQYDEGTWNPVVTAGSGTVTTYTAQGSYTRIGRMVTACAKVVVTTPGTAAFSMLITLPFTPVGAGFSGSSCETALTGFSGKAFGANGDPNMYVTTYQNTTYFAAGATVYATLTYFI